MSQWQPGRQLTQRNYKIEKVLGEGGFGIAYKARNLDLDVSVVIKTPNSKLQKNLKYADFVRRFRREAKILAKLCQNPHPHIVRVIDLFDEDRLPCMVMDFIPGESLFHIVGKEGRLSEQKAIEYIQQVGSALDYCHRHNIIHRDAHPNNIIIRSDNNKAVLIDFGISGNVDLTVTQFAGNQAFAPWEQMASQEQKHQRSPQIDVYTLAATFYYLVTGQTPTPSLARKFTEESLKSPKKFNLMLSDAVENTILRGMKLELEDVENEKSRPKSIKSWLSLLSNTSRISNNINQKKKNQVDNREIIADSRSMEEILGVLIQDSQTSNTSTSVELIPALNSKTEQFLTAINYSKAEEYFKLGKSKIEKKDFKSAIDDLDRAIEINPNNAEYYYYRGIVYGKKHDYFNGIKDLDKAIKLNINSADYYYERGNIQYSRGEYAYAYEDYNKAFLKKSNNSTYLVKKIDAYNQLDSYQREILKNNILEDYTQVIKLGNADDKCYFERGCIFFKLKEYNKAIADYCRAININDKNEAYFYQAARVCELLNEYEVLIGFINKAIEINPVNDTYYNYRGIAFFELKKFSKAIDDHTKSIEINSDNYKYFTNRANAYYEIEKYKEALNDYYKVISLVVCKEPILKCYHQLITLDNNPDLYHKRALFKLIHLNEYQQAIEDVVMAIKLNPDRTKEYINHANVELVKYKCANKKDLYLFAIGNAYCELKHYKKAIENYYSAISHTPKFRNSYWIEEYKTSIFDCYKMLIRLENSPKFYYERGLFQASFLKNYKLAIEDISTAIQLDSQQGVYYHARAAAYYELKEYENALEDCINAIKLSPKDSDIYNDRGEIYLEIQEYQKAIDDFSIAIKLNINKDVYYYNRGQIYLEIQEYQKAIDDFSIAIKLNTKTPKYYFCLAKSYHKQEKYKEAIYNYNKAIKIDSQVDTFFCERGIAYLEIEKYENAIYDFTKAISLESQDPDYYRWRGIAYFLSKEYKNAFADCTHTIFSCLKDPYSMDYYYRAEVCFHLKRYQNAIKDCSKAIELDPNNESFYELRGQCYEISGYKKQAKEDFKRAKEVKRQKRNGFFGKIFT